MDNTMNVNYMTKFYADYTAGYSKESSVSANSGSSESKGAKGFTDKVEEKRAAGYRGARVENWDAEAVKKAEAAAKKAMSLEEYKQYIHNEISRIPLHPSQTLSSISIHISEDGFKAMQEDPEYEKWVLDTLKEDFAFNDPFSTMCGGHYIVHYFGAQKEDYHGHSWYPEYQNGNGSKLYNEKSKGSFWERRVQTRAEQNEQYEKELNKKARKKKLEHERAQKAYFAKLMQQRAYNSQAVQSGNVEKQMQRAADMYDSNVITLAEDLMGLM